MFRIYKHTRQSVNSQYRASQRALVEHFYFILLYDFGFDFTLTNFTCHACHVLRWYGSPCTHAWHVLLYKSKAKEIRTWKN